MGDLGDLEGSWEILVDHGEWDGEMGEPGDYGLRGLGNLVGSFVILGDLEGSWGILRDLGGS